MTTYKTVEHGDGSVTILDSDGNILDGNNRVQALMSMFRTEPTLVVSESPREYKVVDGEKPLGLPCKMMMSSRWMTTC